MRMFEVLADGKQVNEKAVDRKKRKRAEAEERNEAWSALTREEQRASLMTRPGSCRKQLDRLNKEK